MFDLEHPGDVSEEAGVEAIQGHLPPALTLSGTRFNVVCLSERDMPYTRHSVSQSIISPRRARWHRLAVMGVDTNHMALAKAT